jgi:hypothetical protein
LLGFFLDLPYFVPQPLGFVLRLQDYPVEFRVLLPQSLGFGFDRQRSTQGRD